MESETFVPATPFAYLVFYLWPVLCIALFASLRPTLAAAITIIGGALLLPERLALTLPGLPPIDKYALANLCGLLGTLATRPQALGKVSFGTYFLFALLPVSWLVTFLTNRHGVTYGPTYIPGLDLSAFRFHVLTDVFRLVVPMLVGEALFRRMRDLLDVLLTLAIGATLYTFPMLIELRLSPQLHNWLYGYYAHDFRQAMRAGGYRPTVFLTHGLTVAKFMHEGVTIALLLRELRLRWFGLSAGLWAAWCLFVLILSKNLASLLYSLFCGAVLLLFAWKGRARLAMLLLAVAFTYPALRATDLFPTETLVGWAHKEGVTDPSQDRAASLEFRFDNEDLLLEHALRQPYFGWGGHDRNRVYDSRGVDVAVTDGTWVIELGCRGAIGAFLWFCLLARPILAVRKRYRARWGDSTDSELRILTGCMLLLAVSWVDLLPNAGPMAYLMLLSGAVVGATRAAPSAEAPRARLSTRFDRPAP